MSRCEGIENNSGVKVKKSTFGHFVVLFAENPFAASESRILENAESRIFVEGIVYIDH